MFNVFHGYPPPVICNNYSLQKILTTITIVIFKKGIRSSCDNYIEESQSWTRLPSYSTFCYNAVVWKCDSILTGNKQVPKKGLSRTCTHVTPFNGLCHILSRSSICNIRRLFESLYDKQGRSDRGGGVWGYIPPTFLGQSVIFYFTR